MSGYKRVNFYELCRLCATNQQKEKTHIFQEEGRKIQLQNKIQSCLSLKVCENDFLPKVVCSQCLRTLEECYTFRNECVTSETMLSSYFNNFRYTEDFKKSGKVYIKDVAPKIPQATEPVMTSTVSNTTSVLHTSSYEISEKNHEQFFAVQMPTQHEQKISGKADSHKVPSPTSYNLNSLNFAALKGIVQNVPKGDGIGNIAVNANGEIINITPLLDLESILINSTQKPAKYLSNAKLSPPKRIKAEPIKNDNVILDANIIQIDLNQSSNNDIKYDKLPHIKSTNNKYTYTIKIEDGTKCSNLNQAVVVNQVPNVNLPLPNNQAPYNQAAFVSSQPNTNLNGASNLNISNPLNNWNFTPSQSTHLTTTSATPTTSNLSATSGGAAANIVSTPNVNIVATSNISSMPSSSHVNIVSSSISTNPALGQITPDSAGMNFSSNSTWNVNSNSTGTNPNLNASGAPFNATQQNFQCVKPEGYSKKMRSSALSNAVIVSNLPLVKEEQNQSKLFPCDSCQKVFKRREHLYQHIKLHTGFRPFVCENCNKSFMRKEHLMRHMTSHSGLKNYTCDLCSKSFSRNDNLLKHKKTHDKQTSFTCEICQKQFVMKHYYLAHRLTHETEKCPVPLWNVLKT